MMWCLRGGDKDSAMNFNESLISGGGDGTMWDNVVLIIFFFYILTQLIWNFKLM